MRVLLTIWRIARWRGLSAIAAGLGAGFSASAFMVLVQSRLGGGVPSAGWTVAFAASIATELALASVSRVQLSKLIQANVLPTLKSELVRRLLAAPLRTLERIGAARIQGAFTLDLHRIALSISAWGKLAETGAATVAALGYVFWLSPRAFPLVVGALAGGLVVFWALSARARRLAVREHATQVRAESALRAVVEGVKELKQSATARRRFLAEELEPTVREYHSLNTRSGVASAWAGSVASLILLGTIGVLLFSGFSVSLLRSALGRYAIALGFLHMQLTAMISIVPQVRNGEVGAKAIDGIVTDSEWRAPQDQLPQVLPWSGIELEGILHSYLGPNEAVEFTLGPLQFTVRPGEIVFVVGGNGSGKSTFAKLLAGLYSPNKGEIRLNGRAIVASQLDAYREMFSAVMSDCHVFDRLYGLGGDNFDSRANAYVEILKLGGKVRVEGGAFSTVELSTGQRKRLALVTALLEDRPICIFDEWAAEQDPEFKKIFYTQLLPELRTRGKSAIVITHDDHYFQCADRIVRFEGGRIVEDAPMIAGRSGHGLELASS